MDIKFQRIGIVVLVAAITLGALIGLQLGWKKYMMDDPVTSKLANIQGVNNVQISTDSTDTGAVVVTLGKVSNLKQECSALLQAVGSDNKIVLKDNRSPELQALLDQVRFNVEEALVKGDFTAMHAAIDQAAQNAKLDSYAVYMDGNYIYLQFHKGQNYLYQVFPRQPDKAQIFTKG